MQFKPMIGKLRLAASLVLVAGGLLSTACTVNSVHNNKSIGSINSQADARQVVRIGMTMQQVEAKLGSPANKSTFNSRTTWVYGAITTPLSGKNILAGSLTGRIIPDQKTVAVTFNAAGRVSGVDYTEQINS